MRVISEHDFRRAKVAAEITDKINATGEETANERTKLQL